MFIKMPENYHLNKDRLRKFRQFFDTENIGNVWKIPFNSGKDIKVSMKKKDEDASNGLWGHSGFPIYIPEMCLLLVTEEQETILDMFMGSGTTALACKRNKRNFIGFEINKEYIDIANKRINYTMVGDFTKSSAEESYNSPYTAQSGSPKPPLSINDNIGGDFV